MSEVHLCFNGVHVQGSLVKLDFRHHSANAGAYEKLFSVCDKDNRKNAIAIRNDEFYNGFTLYAFGIDLDGDYVNLICTGKTHLSIRFIRSTDVFISCIAVGTFSAFVDIVKMCNVTLLRS